MVWLRLHHPVKIWLQVLDSSYLFWTWQNNSNSIMMMHISVIIALRSSKYEVFVITDGFIFWGDTIWHSGLSGSEDIVLRRTIFFVLHVKKRRQGKGSITDSNMVGRYHKLWLIGDKIQRTCSSLCVCVGAHISLLLLLLII